MNRTKFVGKITFLCLSLLFSANSYPQVQWQKHVDNPVLTTGATGAWDSDTAAIISVIYDNGMYKAWYVGNSSIGYATSSDGIIWTKYANNPVLLPGNPGEWDQNDINIGSVLLINGTYRMWYMGEDDSSIRIGYATSSNGIDWEKYSGNPVLQPGQSGAWDEIDVMHPCVIYDGSTYHMWYNGYANETQQLGYATSSDGINWTKYSGIPVLTNGGAGAWDERITLMSVLKTGDEYKMWYGGINGSSDADYFRSGYATSTNGIDWNKYESNPVLSNGEAGTWDSLAAIVTFVLFDSSQQSYKMWYAGWNDGNDGAKIQTGYATSDTTTSLHTTDTVIPHSYTLRQNYPNPFNPITTITFKIDFATKVRLIIYDFLGREMDVLVDKYLPAGTYSLLFNAANLSSGVYFYKLQADGKAIATRKMIIIR